MARHSCTQRSERIWREILRGFCCRGLPCPAGNSGPPTQSHDDRQPAPKPQRCSICVGLLEEPSREEARIRGRWNISMSERGSWRPTGQRACPGWFQVRTGVTTIPSRVPRIFYEWENPRTHAPDGGRHLAAVQKDAFTIEAACTLKWAVSGLRIVVA